MDTVRNITGRASLWMNKHPLTGSEWRDCILLALFMENPSNKYNFAHCIWLAIKWLTISDSIAEMRLVGPVRWGEWVNPMCLYVCMCVMPAGEIELFNNYIKLDAKLKNKL